MLTLDRVYKAKRVLSEVVRQTDMIRAKKHQFSMRCLFKNGKFAGYRLVQGERLIF